MRLVGRLRPALDVRLGGCRACVRVVPPAPPQAADGDAGAHHEAHHQQEHGHQGHGAARGGGELAALLADRQTGYTALRVFRVLRDRKARAVGSFQAWHAPRRGRIRCALRQVNTELLQMCIEFMHRRGRARQLRVSRWCASAGPQRWQRVRDAWWPTCMKWKHAARGVRVGVQKLWLGAAWLAMRLCGIGLKASDDHG